MNGGLRSTAALVVPALSEPCARGGSNRAIGLRADMDALFMLEMNEFDHKYVNKGKMHACGHDGHTTMLLGAARYLSEAKSFNGTIHFIF